LRGRDLVGPARGMPLPTIRHQLDLIHHGHRTI
jgi:hypothetical protein